MQITKMECLKVVNNHQNSAVPRNDQCNGRKYLQTICNKGLICRMHMELIISIAEKKFKPELIIENMP